MASNFTELISTIQTKKMSAFVGMNCNNWSIMHAVYAERAKQDARICWLELQ
jgi:hypothetical protein